VNGSEVTPPEHGPLFEADSGFAHAIEELLAEPFDTSPESAVPGAGLTEPDASIGRPDRRVSRDIGVGVFRLDLPGLALIARALGNAAAERLVPHIENALARSIRAEDRIERIRGTSALIIIAGVTGEGAGSVTCRAIADRLCAAVTATGEPVEPVITLVPRVRDVGRQRLAGS
jgi:hypothetical protein